MEETEETGMLEFNNVLDILEIGDEFLDYVYHLDPDSSMEETEEMGMIEFNNTRCDRSIKRLCVL